MRVWWCLGVGVCRCVIARVDVFSVSVCVCPECVPFNEVAEQRSPSNVDAMAGAGWGMLETKDGRLRAEAG